MKRQYVIDALILAALVAVFVGSEGYGGDDAIHRRFSVVFRAQGKDTRFSPAHAWTSKPSTP